MEEILRASNRGIYLSSGAYKEFDDGNLDPEITNRIVKSVVIYENI